MNIDNMTPAVFILRGIAVIVSLTLHEYAHALVSTIQGDETPGRYGRLTTNPMAHLDIMGLVALFLFRFGWAKPVPISSSNYKNRRLGIILTSIAGPATNFLLAFLSCIVFYALAVSQGLNSGVETFLTELFIINVGLGVFNLLPFPPLDGSKVVAETLGERAGNIIYRMDRRGIAILFILLWIPQVNSVFTGIIIRTANFIDGIASSIILRVMS